ncbi:MAG: hypothetical protein ABI680_02115 [Chthoniobacteraceae bacterium]
MAAPPPDAMLALQSPIAKIATALIAIRAVAGLVTAGFNQLKPALDVGGKLNEASATERNKELIKTHFP